MTATAERAAAAEAVTAVADGGITRLNSTDGLFLRAEHLTAMQDYARELARCAGLAAGSGVVYGYGVSLSGSALTVRAGLAIDAVGRPLRSQKDLVLSLADLTDAPDRFWVVELTAADPVLSGNEPVFGNLCDDPCTPATIQPWSTEGTAVQVRPDTMPGLADPAVATTRRNWLASAYFERERGRGGPWLTPGEAGEPVTSILAARWSEPAPAPAGAAVPIALLQLVDGRWVLDVWAGRRDLDGAPSQPAWQWRLGMRPWPVFLAQVLQFQDQLAASWGSEGLAASRGEFPDGPLRIAQAAIDRVRQASRKSQLLIECANALEGVMPSAGPEAGTLRDLGFRELPPAGFLPATPEERRRDLNGHYAALLGDAVAVRICHCRADHVPLAVEQAQHLDRIPLVGADGATAVDILVPDQPTDLPALRPGGGDRAYGWVAFVRRSGARCERPTDDVDVYLLTFGGKIEELTEFADPDHKLGTLSYPKDAWEYPAGDVVTKLLSNSEWTAKKDNDPRLLAVTHDESRRPLAALRATLFAASIDAGIAAPPVSARQQPDVAAREAIVVVLSPAG